MVVCLAWAVSKGPFPPKPCSKKQLVIMKKGLILALGFILAPLWAVAQNLITGHITDVRTGEPLIGASVIVKSEKSKGVVTDIDGNFSLQTKVEAPLTLKVEFIGYRPLDVDVYDFEEPVEITLKENYNNIEGIVVTGVAQGTSRKGLSFALTKVSDELINTVPQTDASTTLRGKVAGIRIEQSEGNQGAKVYLRGAKSINGNIEPLIVVDGFTTMVISLWLIAGILTMMLGITGLYIGKIFDRVKGRPVFIIGETINFSEK